MKRNDYLVIAVIVIAIALILTYEFTQNQRGAIPTSFTLNNRTYALTAYAATPKALENGLMNATVTNGTFMLFYFGQQPGMYPFWMKDTYSPLDIIWLNYSSATGLARVVYIANATPCISYSPNQGNCTIYTPTAYANYVLEARAGFVQRSGVNLGSELRLNS